MKKVKKLAILLIFFLPIVAVFARFGSKITVTDEETYKLLKIADVAFSTSPNVLKKGILRQNDASIFYFIDAMTEKNIRFFDKNDSLIQETSLKKVLETERAIAYAEPLSLDSIAVLSIHTTRIYLLNRKGDIVKITNLINLLPAEKRFELDMFNQATFDNGNTLYLQNSPLEDSNYYSKNIDTCRLAYNKAALEPCFTGYYDIFSDRPFYKFESDSLLKRICPLNYFTFPSNNISCSNTDLVVYPLSMGNKIYVFDKENVRLTKEVNLTSKFTKFTCKPLLVDAKFRSNPESVINTSAQTCGAIRNVIRDSWTDMFYIIVIHAVPFDSPKEKKGINRDWSLILADRNFSILHEENMKGTDYSFNAVFPTKEGIYIGYNQNNKNYDDSKAQFALFSFKKR